MKKIMSNVYIIFSKNWSLEEIKQELQEEGYDHNFFFGRTAKTYEEKVNAMKIANEVWIFGDVNGIEDYELAKSAKKDIWIMG